MKLTLWKKARSFEKSSEPWKKLGAFEKARSLGKKLEPLEKKLEPLENKLGALKKARSLWKKARNFVKKLEPLEKSSALLEKPSDSLEKRQLPDGSQRFVGSDNQGMYVSKNMSYEELVSIVHTIVNYDVNKYNVDLQSISIVPSATCRTSVRNDNDVQFMLGEDRVIPQVCVSLIERATGDVIRNDIHAPENTQPSGSASRSNQVFTQRSATEDEKNICAVQPVVVDHADVGEPQFDDVFGCRFEMNDGQYNEQYNEMYNEDNTEMNLGPNQEMILIIPQRGLFPEQIHTQFGIGRSTTLVAEEPTSMIYKGQFFPTKKDLKRLVGLFAMRRNFEWKVKRSNKTTLHLVCLIDNGTWKLRAVKRDERRTSK
ncbi:hypothetical protein Dsin_021885 [Dipteronia sinensis]|uniref:Transposase MuDR plant domain-containing protein n=1 Tax=Dipteronia sinensis TaxID=43782 RepID=A0AAE0A0Y6_9ROSI|nr:hypothetical protein Dsin_021885 [Dipteronia sinensis]